ncbi:hypothetical protein KKG31_00155 [Patescibacteria group bacterium]|nr:hypothetical protein [Patescibacteria group bacterium]MBU1757603.1 hypothetical protein [Patescibacteria group bacterium]
MPIEDWNGIVDDALYTKMIAICEGEKEEVVKEEVVDAQEVEKNEKKISLEINYYNTDGTLNKNVGPVRIDQIFDMSTSPDELQITHGTTTKTITK